MKYFTVTLEKYPQPYLKVYFLNDDEAEPTKLLLEQLPAVDHINITLNNAQTRRTLTIYISKVYEPEEARQEVIGMLDCHLEDKMVFREEKAKDLESFLAKYPDVLKQYKSAKEKYEKGIYYRNTLDDMRLALEKLVKNVTKTEANTLSLQKSALGTFLEKQGCDATVRNMLITTYDYFMKYQNDNVKHNDKIARKDIKTLSKILCKWKQDSV